jgi:selenide,water dikinase
MGGIPFLALNIAAFPPELPGDFLGEILRGGVEKAHEAGVIIAGGHTIQDQEPKYGLVAIGFIDPEQMMTKGGARPGDVLALTKPLGFGTTTTAIKQEKASQESTREVIEWMVRLNDQAAKLAVDNGVRGSTDVTGFSLLGHGWEMAKASGVGLKIHWQEVPFISHALDYAKEFIFPGGASDNKLYFGDHVSFPGDFPEEHHLLLFDPQTSGGLLLAVHPGRWPEMQAQATQDNIPLWKIGEVVEGDHIDVV